ncbi:MAG: SLBB domain-containing protein [Candidatus Neomarinimicrobiota bacterium]
MSLKKTMYVSISTYLILVLAWLLAVPAGAQLRTSDLPKEVLEELKFRGIAIEQILLQAESLGIDLSNPQRAALRARQLGVPESQIQEMLRVANEIQRVRASLSTAPGRFERSGEAFPSLSQPRRTTEAKMLPAVDTTAVDTLELVPGREKLMRPLYFGYDMFKQMPEAFEPSPVGPVDEAYLVGPGDELRLTVWGAAEFQYDLQVDREGRVYVSNVGQFMVAGKRLDRLRRDMKRWLSRTYAGLETDPPTVFMDITITRLRPIKVFILGELARPGGYSLNSYSTIFNALYGVGGPLTRGSLRDIQVIREGKVLAKVDFYNYLLKGYDPNPVQLQDNDHIFIPLRGKTVAISGEVKRPAIYELKQREHFTQLLEYVGGLTANAYVKRVQIERIVPFEKRNDPSIAREVLDVDLEPVLAGERNIQLFDSDSIRVFSILSILENAVSIFGAVKQPGRYELNESVLTIRDLIMKADSLTGDAYLGKADLVRTRDDSTEVFISINLEGVLGDQPTQNLPLLPRDRVLIYSVQDLEEIYQVEIVGQVRNPGVYAWRDSMTVYDLLFQGGGLLDEQYLKDVFLERADLFRKAPNSTGEIIIPFHLGTVLEGREMASELLQPNDRIRIYTVYVEEIMDRYVNIHGAVKAPGQYSLQRNMTVEDLILQAGGFTEDAYLVEAQLSRVVKGGNSPGEKAIQLMVPLTSKRLGEVSFALKDTTLALQQARKVPLNHRDIVYIRTDPDYTYQDTVTVTGEVRFPGQYTLLKENETLSNVIKRAGSVLPTGYARGGRLMRGKERVVIDLADAIEGKKRADVTLLPGDEIIIPPKPNTVAVRGNVAIEGLIKYAPGRRLSYYLEQGGGTGEKTESVFLTQASGATFKIRKIMWLFRRNPVVDDGAIITVTKKPEEEERAKTDIGRTITDVFALLSSVITVIVLAQRINP